MSAPENHPSERAITLHPPLTTGAGELKQREQQPPSVAWLAGSWHVTHSTLPMWRSKRTVVITYTALPDAKLDDVVEYKALDSGAKSKTVRGVDTPLAGSNGWAWDWRGRGWLAIASSRWEVLGYGDEPGEAEGKRQWVVTYFAKTLFTPAGIDIYSRHPEGLRAETVGAVKAALAGIADAEVRQLAEGLFEVKMD